MVFSTVKLFFIILLACVHPKVLLPEADLMSPPSAQSHSPLCIASRNIKGKMLLVRRKHKIIKRKNGKQRW
jgi:hypothetical protein